MIHKDEYFARCTSLKKKLNQIGLDAMLFVKDANLRYFEGYTGRVGYLLVTEERNYLFADSRHLEQAIGECATAKVVPIGPAYPPYQEILSALCRKHAISRLGFESTTLVWERHKKIKSVLGGVHFSPTKYIGEWVRSVKSQEERRRIRMASEMVSRALAQLLPKVVPGISELRVARELEYLLALEGAEETAFATLVAFGARSSLPHSTPRADVILKEGDIVLIDCGARWGGYCSDCSRTFVCGTSTSEQRERYNLLLQARDSAVKKLRDQERISSVHEAMSKVLHQKQGQPTALHGLGHGVGLEVHEWPLIHEEGGFFEAGHVVAIEPGLYFTGWGGMRVEDTVHIGTENAERYTLFPAEELIELIG